VIRTLLLAFALVATAVAQVAKPCTAVGKDRWEVKTSAPLAAARPRSLAFADFAKWPAPADPASLRTARTRSAAAVGGLREGDLVSLTGWIRLLATSSDDCDFHIEVEAAAAGAGGAIIVEIPQPDAQHVAGAALRPQLVSARRQLLAALKIKGAPSLRGNLIGKAYMTATGALFFDAWHYPACAKRGKQQAKLGAALTCWEIHPVISVAFAPRPAS